MLLHKIISLFISLGYLVFVLFNTSLKIDKISLNFANIDEIKRLPGIGKKLADRIVLKRPFYNFNDLLKVDGLNKKILSYS